MVTTCFGRAWPSSGHNVDVLHKWENHNCMSGWFAAAIWVAANQPDIQLWFSHLCTTSTLWPEDGQARPKHIVTIAAINTIPRQLCFWRTLLPFFNICKHNGDDVSEDTKEFYFDTGLLSYVFSLWKDVCGMFRISIISGFCHGVNEVLALLGFYKLLICS
jgi:hypothetical protein